MNNEQERDTHFQGFAKLLCEEIANLALNLSTEENNIVDGCIICNWPSSKVAEFIAPLIAQRAYDLVKHATEHINKNAIYTEHPRFDAFMLAIVPDLTEWPKTALEASAPDE